MNQTITHIRNTFTSIGDIYSVQTDLRLQLFCTLHAVRYFVVNMPTDEVIYFGDYTIHHAITQEEVIDQLKNILTKDAALQRNFQQVFIASDSSFDLLPAAFYEPNEERADSLLNDTVFLQYSFSAEMEQLLTAHFGAITIRHIGSSLIEAIGKEHNTLIEKLYVNVNTQTLDVTSFSGDGKFRFFNTYTYKSYQDFIYFVLLVADELKTDRENVELVLSGEVDINSKIYEMCFRYFRNITFSKPAAIIRFSRAFEHYPKHLNYNLYNLGA